MTSSEHSSIKEIWKLLDDDILTPDSTIAITPGTRAREVQEQEFSLVGTHLDAEKRISKNIYIPPKVRQPKRKVKIRNYNRKGDD